MYRFTQGVAANSIGQDLQKTIGYGVIATIFPVWLFSVVILNSAVQAQDNPRKSRAACGKELQKQCTGVPMLANNMLECLKKNHERLSPRCAARPIMSCACVIEMQRNFAKTW